MIEINKVDSLKLIYKVKHIHSVRNRYNFTTKFPWKCLNCLIPIYLSYYQNSVSSVYCKNCISHSINPTIVTYQYLRVLKENQIKLIESFEN